jgi:multicomponent Na+:H+ antiporter subunit D
MTDTHWLPVLIVGSSLVTGILIFLLNEEQVILRSILNVTGATVKLVFVAVIFHGSVVHGFTYEGRYEIVLGFDFVLRVDLLSLVFVTLSSVLWWVTTIYAIGYLEGSPNRRRFFGFFSMCVTASVGIALAGNLITFFIFYEFLTLATYPLVVHRGTEVSLKAGRTYLIYTLTGGSVLFLGVAWLHAMVGPVDFGQTELLQAAAAGQAMEVRMLFWVLVLSLGVKAALFPLHGWLPVAMVAPAPVSALLHAVAVVKAGAFGIVRVVYDVYGIRFAHETNLLLPLAALASATVIYGSLRALSQDDLKKRLAYSTVSQLSYIALGVGIFGPAATVGSLVHLVHQGLMKITLFFCAGNVSEILGLRRVSEMAGVGRRMPLTMACFTVAAFGMIGVPPVAGFVTKWYLGLGGIQAGEHWVIAVLIVSTVLNAAYFLPVVYRAWFKEPQGEWETQRPSRLEAPWLLLAPPLITAFLSLFAGLFANTPLSPLELAEQIAEEAYRR